MWKTIINKTEAHLSSFPAPRSCEMASSMSCVRLNASERSEVALQQLAVAACRYLFRAADGSIGPLHGIRCDRNGEIRLIKAIYLAATSVAGESWAQSLSRWPEQRDERQRNHMHAYRTTSIISPRPRMLSHSILFTPRDGHNSSTSCAWRV